mmetsp:Transcript_3675/g.6017  ORF Transcript_3675/g.6017 Transcript_3675/m.6017 type:complete len:93 (-) Transcript_3675:1821-2099(-)
MHMPQTCAARGVQSMLSGVRVSNALALPLRLSSPLSSPRPSGSAQRDPTAHVARPHTPRRRSQTRITARQSLRRRIAAITLLTTTLSMIGLS